MSAPAHASRLEAIAEEIISESTDQKARVLARICLHLPGAVRVLSDEAVARIARALCAETGEAGSPEGDDLAAALDALAAALEGR